MPNRCYNHVKIEASPKVIDEIKKTIYKKSWFKNFYPIPKELELSESPPQRQFWEDNVLLKQRIIRFKKLYWAKDWYDWTTKNWWTKRDVVVSILNETDTSLELEFDSARSPPTEALLKLSEIYTWALITHKFSEEWNYFSWIYEYKNWEIISQEDFEDPYFGGWKMCEVCWRKYDPDNEEMRYDEDQTICIYCWEK